MLLILTSSEASGGLDLLALSGAGNFFWTLLIFFVALPLMWKMVMGPVTRALEERDDHASRAIAAAQQAQAEAEKARADVEVALGEAQTEAAKLLAEARKRAEVREQEIVEAAKQEASGMVDAAKKAIRAEQDKAISTIRNEVVDISMHAASKVLGRNVDSDDDRRFVSELVTGREASAN